MTRNAYWQTTANWETAGFRKLLGVEKILNQRNPGFVDIRIYFMGNRGPGLECKPHADITADLADPNRLALVTHGTEPYPQMIALMDGVARLLPGKILRAPVKIERAQGRIAIA